MAELPNLPSIDRVEMQYLDLWFANIVDTINYDLGQIEVAVPALAQQLTTVDTAPIQYLRDSLDKLVDGVNKGFVEINEKFRSLDSRIEALEARPTSAASSNKGGS